MLVAGVAMTDFHIILTAEGEDGLNVASALRYAALAGLRFINLVLPGDGCHLSQVAGMAEQVRRYSLYADVEACLGIELRHVPPALIPAAVRDAREAGAELVLVYGETLCDQVAEGTNFAAVEAGADIITHPGLIDAETAAFAAEKGVALEFTSCPRHALCNAHTAAMALRFSCPLVRGSAASCAAEITGRSSWPRIIRGADVFEKKDDRSNLFELLMKSENALVQRLLNDRRENKKIKKMAHKT